MLPQWIIEKKRDGKALEEREIRFLIEGYTDGSIPDYQMAAFAMAVCLKGMNADETAVLTDAMMRSGEIIGPDDLPGVKVDKHSTGGIGDKISIPLAPLAAACGITVPMIAGRGLGITGGTVDKLESIPGYRTDLSIPEFKNVLKQCGCSIIGQTPELAPADRKLYALRDVTGTVPSIPLITASILSKKLAEGIDALVMDVKFGSGAFMKTEAEARQLAGSILQTAERLGRKAVAVISGMNEPLGRCVGNALEIGESLEILNGGGTNDETALTLELAKQMLRAAGKPTKAARDKLNDGSALQKFREMVRLQGGDLSAPRPEASRKTPLPALASGFIAEADAKKIGEAALLLGAGRSRTDDRINPAAGISDLMKIGEPVDAGQPLCLIHSDDPAKEQEALQLLGDAFRISEKEIEPPPRIRDVLCS